ncbi:hypothetical protein SCAR479_00273 [Seiridium cardinale]|uniref:Uncharacterized protein n=1 Tax=Seiridium cardinale TaxID=138064 RepID=A0ABR2Y913_9PEZI
MTRKIPWRDGSMAQAPSPINSTRGSATPTAIKRVKVEDKKSDAAKSSASSIVFNPKTNRPPLRRSRSNSQPPEPLEETLMVDGLDKDDMYRMVEDEFYVTASRFTAHLHAAEYQRLQADAKSYNATTIKNISRPVVGRMTELVRKKTERSARRQHQKGILKGGTGNVNVDEDDTLRGNSLFGLMESPRKTVPPIDHFALEIARTPSRHPKAPETAARFSSLNMSPTSRYSSGARSKSVQKKTLATESEEEEEEDLDVMPRRKTLFPPTGPIPMKTSTSRQSTVDKSTNHAEPSHAQTKTQYVSKPAENEGQHDGINAQASDEDSDGDLFGFQKRAKSRVLHNQKNAKSDDTNQRRASRDVIPSFI